MRTVFIFLFVGVLFTFIQYSNGAPRRVRSLDYDEIPNSMKKFVYKLKPYMNEDSSEEDDELNENEKKKVVDTHQYIEKSEESSSEQNKEEDNDNQTMLSRFMGDDRENILQNSDEN